jgi:hypothetical protein
MEGGDAGPGSSGHRAGFRRVRRLGVSIDRDDFVKQVVEDLRGEGFGVHVALADVTKEAQMVRAFADIGEVAGNRSWTFTQLEAGLPGAADTTEPGTELLPGIDEATRHPRRQAWAGDRPILNPPHNSARPGHQRMTPRPAAQARIDCRVRGDSQTSRAPR